MFRQCIEIIKSKYESKVLNIKFEISTGLKYQFIKVDIKKIKIILIHLLSNAAKFSIGKSPIMIEAHQLVEDNKNFIEISIADLGIGIDSNQQTKIFENFYQVKNNYNNKTPGLGLGLGLSIAAKLIEMHGGHLKVTSEGEGKGSCFSFTIQTF
ncbi:MAG: ATP-binding protein [Desulfobacterales bacterium]|nr:ATP-binding protein [Desulfobacterales bacterium]